MISQAVRCVFLLSVFSPFRALSLGISRLGDSGGYDCLADNGASGKRKRLIFTVYCLSELLFK